ncbi:MAG: NADH-quinone oxidoreductase subunit M [Pseudomonadota bacterium]
MADWPILSILIFLPLVGVAFIVLVRGTDPASVENIRRVALITTVFNFAASFALWVLFDPVEPAFQFVEKRTWIAGLANYHVGVDGISMPFVVLVAALMPFCVLVSYTKITDRVRQFMVALLVLETLLIGAFCALDLVLFYIFFAGSTLPLLVIIGGWGGARRISAAYKFFQFSLASSGVLLLSLIALFFAGETSDIVVLQGLEFSEGLQLWLWLALFIAFAIAMALWPVHTWMVDAVAEAPAAAAALVCAVGVKLGFYGFARLVLPLFPEASAGLSWLGLALGLVTIGAASLLALVQRDLMKMIAYAAMVPMGFALLALFALNQQSVQGALVVVVGHGVAVAALIFAAAAITQRANTGEITAYGGLAGKMPWLSAILLVATLSVVFVPGTVGFVGAFLAFVGVFEASPLLALIAAVGLLAASAAGFMLYSKVVLGPLETEAMRRMTDLSMREKLSLAPLALLVVIFGIFPQSLLTVSEASVNRLVAQHERATATTTGPLIDTTVFAVEGSTSEAVRQGIHASGVAPGVDLDQ